MYKRNLLLLLLAGFNVGLIAMDGNPITLEKIQSKNELKQRVKADPKAVILPSAAGTEPKFIMDTGHDWCSFMWGNSANNHTTTYNECFAEDLAPFLSGTTLNQIELHKCVRRYPGVDSNEILRLVLEIRGEPSKLSRQARKLQKFVKDYIQISDNYPTLSLKEKIQQAKTREDIVELVADKSIPGPLELKIGGRTCFCQKDGEQFITSGDSEDLEECFAEELAPFIFDGRALKALPGCIEKYPVKVDEILLIVRDIRDGHSVLPSNGSFEPHVALAHGLRKFVAEKTGNNNLWTGKNYWRDRWTHRNNRKTTLCIKLAAATVVVAGIAYGIYHIFFAKKKVAEDEEEITADADLETIEA